MLDRMVEALCRQILSSPRSFSLNVIKYPNGECIKLKTTQILNIVGDEINSRAVSLLMEKLVRRLYEAGYTKVYTVKANKKLATVILCREDVELPYSELKL